jgi:hypothetical protein
LSRTQGDGVFRLVQPFVPRDRLGVDPVDTFLRVPLGLESAYGRVLRDDEKRARDGHESGRPHGHEPDSARRNEASRREQDRDSEADHEPERRCEKKHGPEQSGSHHRHLTVFVEGGEVALSLDQEAGISPRITCDFEDREPSVPSVRGIRRSPHDRP